jgi:hypothetical protein
MKKTIREWIEELNEPERSRALANLDDNMEKELVGGLPKAIKCGFGWKNTPEGYDYWSDIYDSVVGGRYVFDRGAVVGQSIEERIDRLIESIDKRMQRVTELEDTIREALRVVNGATADERLSNIWEDILENFDWERVHKMMLVTNWTWHSVGGVPTVSELKKELKSAVERVYYSTDFVLESRGFRVTKESDEHGLGTISIEFVGASWSVDFGVDEDRL